MAPTETIDNKHTRTQNSQTDLVAIDDAGEDFERDTLVGGGHIKLADLDYQIVKANTDKVFAPGPGRDWEGSADQEVARQVIGSARRVFVKPTV